MERLKKTEVFILIGMYTDFTKDIPFEKRAELIAKNGFDSVIMYYENAEDFEKNVRTVKGFGLRIESVHCPFGMMNRLWTDENAMEVILKMQSAVDSCWSFGIHTLVVHVTDGKNPPAENMKGIMYFAGLVRYAKRKEVNIAFENIERPEYLKCIFENIVEENAGLCFDVGHQNCFEKDFDVLDNYKKQIFAIHVHDNDGKSDGHMIPFDADICYDDMLKRLAKAGWNGGICLEIMKYKTHFYDDVSNEEYVKKAYSSGKKLYNMLKEYKKEYRNKV